MADVLVRYAHFIGIFVLVSTLVTEHMLLKSEMTAAEIKKIARLDAVYGISALVVLMAGLALWLWVGKPAEFYTKNMVFHSKFTLFILVALLSIYPTLFFIKNRKSTAASIVVPKSIIMMIRLELLLVFVIPLLAVLMARGIGL